MRFALPLLFAASLHSQSLLVITSGIPSGTCTGSTPTFVQEKTQNDAGGSSTATQNVIAITTTTGANRAAIVACAVRSATSVTSITDTGGDTFSAAKIFKTDSGSGNRCEIWGVVGITGSTSFTINTGASGFPSCSVLEYSGASGFGGTGTAVSPSAGTALSVPVTTTACYSKVIACVGSQDNVTYSTSDNLRVNNSGSAGMQLTVIDHNTTTIGAYNVTGIASGTTTAASAAVELQH